MHNEYYWWQKSKLMDGGQHTYNFNQYDYNQYKFYKAVLRTHLQLQTLIPNKALL